VSIRDAALKGRSSTVGSGFVLIVEFDGRRKGSSSHDGGRDVAARKDRWMDDGGASGLKAGEIRMSHFKGFSPGGKRSRGLKASCIDSERGPEGPLFHGGADVSGIRSGIGLWNPTFRKARNVGHPEFKSRGSEEPRG